jgi:acyl-CoA thioesterase I
MRKIILYLLLTLSVSASVVAGASAASKPITAGPILVLGDSLSAAYHIDSQAGWVNLLAQRLKQQTPAVQLDVVNASISGETTAGGLARLPGMLAEHAPSLVLIELGANDGLRGLPVEQIQANLTRMMTLCRDAGAKIILLGIELPLNYGPQYRTGLHDMYRDAARDFNVPLVPFLLDGVALDARLMQDDGLHPRAEGEPKVLDNVWPTVQAALPALH